MNDDPVTDKASMMARIEREWERLQAFIGSLSEVQLTDVRNPDGWALQDHLAHIAAWERSIIFLLRRRPRHEGLGVPAEVFESGDEDAINAIIFQQHRSEPLAQVLADGQATHDELMALLYPMSEAELSQSYRAFLPEPRDGEDYPVYGLVSGNTFGHYEEHLEWMRAQLGQSI